MVIPGAIPTNPITTRTPQVVFTVPHELNSFFICNLDVMLSILFKTASETLRVLALDKKYLGANIGTTMILHTWEQNLSFHPHAHCIVPGGELSPSGLTFVKLGKKFFIPVKVISNRNCLPDYP